ncbi:hypothetical protein ACOSP7_003085 [Xanthoceras sorbifolium]
MHTPQVLLGSSTYNRLVKHRTAPQGTQASDDEREQEQDLSRQEATPMEHRQPQAQPVYDDRLLTAIAAMQSSFEGRMELMEARINSRLDVMEAGMIGLGDRMNIMRQKIDRIESSVIQHYSHRRSRTPPPPPSR